MSRNSIRLSLLAFVVAAQGLAIPALAEDDPVPLVNWQAAPFWTPSAAGRAAEKGSGRAAEITPPLTTPMPYVAITPCRLIDTRSTSGFPASWGAPSLPAGVDPDPNSLTDDRLFPATTATASSPCPIPAGARAIAANVTAWQFTANGKILLYGGSDAVRPTSATVNYRLFTTPAPAANLAQVYAIIPLDAAGKFLAFSNRLVDMIVDVNGYYSPTGIVNSLNTLSGDVTLAPGTNVTITPSGNTLTIAAAIGSAVPSGAAGGSLSGTYPNPGIASGAVGSTQLANNTAVRSINGAAQDLVTLQGSGDVSVSTAGSTITIGAPTGSMLLGAPGDTTLIGAGYTEIAPSRFDYWKPTATSGAPGARTHHSAVWTGSRMIVWGGNIGGGVRVNDGGNYDPVANSWTPTGTTGVPAARSDVPAVWTGSKMIVWGGLGNSGHLNDGGLYDPVPDSWTATQPVNVPSVRYLNTAVWAPAIGKMIVWGGYGGSYLNDGGLYDPAGSGAWTATQISGAPSVRTNHTAVWTGSKMIVWGGSMGAGFYNDGGVYDPTGSGAWAPTKVLGAPSPRWYHTAVWTGSKMIVWGGGNASTYFGDGGVYDPAGDSWTVTATMAEPQARYIHTAVWTGSRMIVWGGRGLGSSGYVNDGGQYEPVGNTWTATTTTGAPAGRYFHTAVWAGSSMIVWGGDNSGSILNDGGVWSTVSLYMKN